MHGSNGMQEALGFHVCPQFHLVRGHGIEVSGLVHVGEGVHAHATVSGNDLVESAHFLPKPYSDEQLRDSMKDLLAA